MFFTSFVEGAQIPLQEAMDFLQRGTEPESIQEQMIWNNRRAWAELSATIYRPLDGDFVRTLAFMLTDEMDGCAEDYRQVDLHPIAAMNNEACAIWLSSESGRCPPQRKTMRSWWIEKAT